MAWQATLLTTSRSEPGRTLASATASTKKTKVIPSDQPVAATALMAGGPGGLGREGLELRRRSAVGLGRGSGGGPPSELIGLEGGGGRRA